MTYEIQQSTTQSVLLFFLTLASDHVSPATGLSPTVTISKNGGAFGAVNGTVTEISSGWYKVAGNATDTNTLGPLALHAAVATADNCDIIVANIVGYNPQSATNLGLSALPTATAGANTGLPVVGTQVPNATAGASAGLLISGSNAGTTTLGALTITGSLTNNGTVDVAQTGDNFARIGAAGVGLTAVTLGAAGSAALTEGYAALHATGTLPQLVYEILALLKEKSVSGTTLTAKKLDGSTTASTYTLSSATAPVSITRTT